MASEVLKARVEMRHCDDRNSKRISRKSGGSVALTEVWSFLGGMFGTRAIEIIAVLCGIANVILIIRRSLWNYPFGLVMVALYA